jgi:hypothetical protein
MKLEGGKNSNNIFEKIKVRFIHFMMMLAELLYQLPHMTLQNTNN